MTEETDTVKQALSRLDQLIERLNDVRSELKANKNETDQIKLFIPKFEDYIKDSNATLISLDKRITFLEYEMKDVRKEEADRKAKQEQTEKEQRARQEQLEAEQRSAKRIGNVNVIGWLISIILFALAIFLK